MSSVVISTVPSALVAAVPSSVVEAVHAEPSVGSKRSRTTRTIEDRIGDAKRSRDLDPVSKQVEKNLIKIEKEMAEL